MKTAKKLLSLMLVVLFTFSGFMISANAATPTESESNDSYATANNLSQSGTISGTINNSDDVDYYKIIATSNGKISVKFKHTYVDNYWGWAVAIVFFSNGSYTQLSEKIVDLRGDESVSLPDIGATASGVYYLKVSNYGNTVNEKYVIETSFTSTNFYEKELNNVFSSANILKPNNTYEGNISSSEDLDYYRITVPENGKIDLSFCHDYYDEWWGWKVEIVCYFDGKYTVLSEQIIDLRGDELVKLPSVGAVPNGTYYIKVTDYGNTIGINYGIKVSFTQTEYFEKEVNDVYSTATLIKQNGTYGGVLNKNEDVDYYRIVSETNGKISIKFNHTYADDSWSGWAIHVINYNNGKYTEIYKDVVSLSDNETVSLQDISTIQSEIYFIKVYVNNNYNSVGANYSIEINGAFAEKKNTVTYNANGGYCSTSSATAESGKDVTLPTPSRSGYTCLGWSTSSSATSATYSCGASYYPSSDITLHAVWKENPKTYNICFNANGGKVSPANTLVSEGISVTLPQPVREGYICLGWSTSSSATSASYRCGTNYYPSSDVTLYAVWKAMVPDDSIEINYKDTYILGYYGFTPVRYYSDNSAVATVSADGTIYGASRGRTYVHAVDAYGNEKVTEVNVTYTVIQWIIVIVLFGWIWY